MTGCALCGALAVTCAAQRNRPPAPQRQERQQAKPERRAEKQNPNRPPAGEPNRSVDRPPFAPSPSAKPKSEIRRENQAARQELGVGASGQWVQRMRSAPPAEREKFFKESPAFRKLPPEKQDRIRQQFSQWDRMTPQQRIDQTEKEQVWRHLTPEQKTHIRNDVFPTWKQMPPERRQAIKQRLSVLQNMPEFARNQRLNDPKFTEGMSDEDRAMLRDLSHMHIGGAPEPPSE